MLIQFTCSNYRSIKEPVVFSMAASKDDSIKGSLISFGKGRYLRVAEVYGANGSGKTSLLDALLLMYRIVLTSNTVQPGFPILRYPHKLSKKKEPTLFAVIFEKNGVKYSYGFSYNEDGIVDEYLHYWPGVKRAVIFERTSFMDYQFADSFKKAGDNCKGRIKPNKLLLSCAANETDIPQVSAAFMFFLENLLFFRESESLFNYSMHQLKNSPQMKAKFLRFMRSIGCDLVDIKIKDGQQILVDDAVSITTTPQMMQNTIGYELKLVYKNFEVDYREESSGVKKLFQFICPMMDVLTNNRVLVCDEIEAHLHPSIVAEIIKRFCQNRDSSSQLITATHDSDLLDLNEVRRDQIWFTELNPKTRSTDLYSLAELKNVRKDENIKKGYILGRYGAIPMLNSNFREK
ncbi:MAG: ATP-binding protein [Fibrobacter sp.]|uniref:AAA family ATPase n=1 Tax=Fibrobacter sp. TaxID=35828 RepID=UPI001AFE21B6|nr:ATP-binding protein [Fibrobacter sp.]MBO7061518.1 ATP-binding protein [Fibrobacter sp.]